MGSSKKQTVGYKYYLGMHAIFCHGPVDRFTRLTFDGNRVGWVGDEDELSRATINVSAPNLFGGDDIGKEGGVSGFLDFEPGAPDQTQNSYLQAQLGMTDIPAFRNVAGLVFRQFYFGTSAYLKKFSARFTRILKTTNGDEQWYPEKAQIVVSGADSYFQAVNLAGNDGASTAALAISGNEGILLSGFDPEDVVLLKINNGEFSGYPPTYEAISVWGQPNISGPSTGTQWLLDIIPGEVAADKFQIAAAGSPFDGYTAAKDAALAQYPSGITLTGASSYRFYIEDNPTSDNTGGISVVVYRNPVIDMNPAHIIRECLTDNNWGMGYNATDIDDTSFEAAADQLFDEGMGISILWDRQMPIEDFIREILKHIDASVYVDRATGKFTIVLIRGGYTVGSLPAFDESNCKLEDFQRPQTGELVNSVTVEYWDTDKNVEGSLTVEDPALVQMQGATINTAVQYPGFTNAVTASRVALRDLRTLSNPLATCTIYAGADAEGLNVGSLLRLSWAEYGIVDMPMRVTGIAFGDGVSNKVKAQLTQDSFALPETGVIAPPDVSWEDPNEPPAPSDYEIAFELPYVELLQQLGLSSLESTLTTTPEVGYAGMAVSRPSASAINAKLMVDAGAGYEEVSTMQFSPIALLAAAIPQEYGSTVVAIDGGIDLDLALELGVVGSWCQIDDELCIVEALSESSITLGRGTLDTVPAPHADNTPIFFWDNFAASDDEQYVLTDTLNLKSLTVTGQGTLDISDATARPLEIVARAIRPYPPAQLVVDGSEYPTDVDFDFDISWFARNRVTQGDVLLDNEDASVTAEGGTTYTVRLYLDDVLEDEIDSISDLFYNDATLSNNGVGRVEVWSVRDTYESYQPLWAEFDYVGAVQFLSTDVPDCTDGDIFSYTLLYEGGVAPYTFSIESGSLPSGLSLDTSTGEISGTPDTPGTSTYTVRITDDNGVFDDLAVSQDTLVGGWTPALITTQFWFDASDSGSITISTGVSQWNDLSGNARHIANATGGEQPSYQTAVQNGLNIVRFDGTDDRLTQSSGLTGLAQDVGQLQIFTVRKWASLPGSAQITVVLGAARANLEGGRTANKPGAGGRRLDADSFAAVAGATNVSTAAFQLHSGYWDWTNNDLFNYVNGAVDGSNTSFQTSGNTSNTAPTILAVGSNVTAANFFNGDMAEIVAIQASGTLASHYRRLMEWYLADKWGLISSLPSGHPYRYWEPKGNDANFATVVFLCHCEAPNNNTAVGDGGITGHTLTFNGTAKIDTAEFKFGTSSLKFDGSAGNVSAPDHADWDLGSGDFCVEFFVRFAALPSAGQFIGQYNASSSNRAWLVQYGTGTGQLTLTMSNNGSSFMTSPAMAWSPSTGVWYHVAAYRVGTNTYVAVDGVVSSAAATGAGAIFNANTTFNIGNSASAGGTNLNCHMDEIRLHKGYTPYGASNFTPPSSEFKDFV